jgi:dUTPase
MIPKFKFALREDLKDKKEFLPTRGEPKASGWDVRSSDDLIIKPFEYAKIRLGFRTMCPEGWWFELKPRSSTFAKKNLHALYGTVDETYEGELIFACQYIPPFKLGQLPITGGHCQRSAVSFDDTMFQTLEISSGDAVGQIIPVKRQEMEVIEATNAEIEEEYKTRAASRGDGGFGSTGK